MITPVLNKLRGPGFKQIVARISNEAFHFKDAQGKLLSPWHDIPLREGQYFNFINEIPKNTTAKMEVSTKLPYNPIAQDTKNGKPRHYLGPIFWNYGCFPQTWEDPNVVHPIIKCIGDNDPLDVVEIGDQALSVGSIHKVKVLGILAMIDDGELDWKVIAINSSDKLASKLDDIADLQSLSPETISGIREWFRWYKTPDNKPLNRYGYDERALDKAAAVHVIDETHEYWTRLRKGESRNKGGLWIGIQ